jgi:uncharacterized membrane protein
MREFLLFAHVTGAILLLGPATLATSRFARHALDGSLAEAVAAHRTSRSYGTASIVVPAVGFALAARIDAFGELWVQAALGLFVAGSLLLALVHLPAQRVAVDRLQAGEEVGPRVVARLRSSAGLYALSWVAVVWLMIDKPA